MKIEIKHRFTNAVLFACDVPENIESGPALRHALEKATKAETNLTGAYLRGADLTGADLTGADLTGADLRDAYLTGANLTGANLRDAYLTGANLRDADLRDAYLRDAYLTGAYLTGAYLTGADGEKLRATDAQSIENLDKVRAIILDDQKRLDMGDWHQDSGWKERTCAEETLCKTTHCLAGWLQVCSTVPEIRQMDAELAGILSAPVAAKMFFKKPEEVLNWLETRAYVEEIARVPS